MAAPSATSGSDEVHGTDHRASAGHGFQHGQSEAFIERRKDEHVAGVIELQQVRVGDEPEEMDAAPPRPIRAPPRERGPQTTSPFRPAPGGASVAGRRAPAWQTPRISPIWFLRGCRSPTERINGAGIGNRPRTSAAAASREIGRNSGAAASGTTTTLSSSRSPYTFRIAIRENSLPVRIRAARRTVRPTVRCNCQARSRVKYSGMFQKADIVHAHYHRHGAADRSRVLHVQQVRPVLPELHRQLESQAQEGIGRDPPGTDVRKG